MLSAMTWNGARVSGIMGKKKSKAPDLKIANDAEYWRERAAEAREMAKHISLAAARRQMGGIADEYERRAEQAERKGATDLRSSCEDDAVA